MIFVRYILTQLPICFAMQLSSSTYNGIPTSDEFITGSFDYRNQWSEIQTEMSEIDVLIEWMDENEHDGNSDNQIWSKMDNFSNTLTSEAIEDFSAECLDGMLGNMLLGMTLTDSSGATSSSSKSFEWSEIIASRCPKLADRITRARIAKDAPQNVNCAIENLVSTLVELDLMKDALDCMNDDLNCLELSLNTLSKSRLFLIKEHFRIRVRPTALEKEP